MRFYHTLNAIRMEREAMKALEQSARQKAQGYDDLAASARKRAESYIELSKGYRELAGLAPMASVSAPKNG